MDTWRDLARSSRTASYELFDAGRWRSSASRAYYAVYSEVTYGLLAAGVTMPATWQNPRHGGLPVLVGNHLRPLNVRQRWELAGLIDDLYGFRIIADYQPHVMFEENDATIALGMMTKAFRILEAIP